MLKDMCLRVLRISSVWILKFLLLYMYLGIFQLSITEKHFHLSIRKILKLEHFLNVKTNPYSYISPAIERFQMLRD
jgi:hypothetical protein